MQMSLYFVMHRWISTEPSASALFLQSQQHTSPTPLLLNSFRTMHALIPLSLHSIPLSIHSKPPSLYIYIQSLPTPTPSPALFPPLSLYHPPRGSVLTS